MSEPAAVETLGQQFEEGAEVRFVEFFCRRKLPENGAETIAKLGGPGIQKALD